MKRLLAGFVLVLIGCGGPVPATDGPPKRIVSLAPNLTEIVFAIGAGDSLVAVTTHCNYPPEAAALPKVGAYMNPNLEVVLARKPDLVLIAKEGRVKAFAEALERHGIRVEAAGAESLDEVIAAIRQVGGAVGNREQADRLADSLAARAEKVRKTCAGLPKVKVMLTYGLDAQICVAGKGSFGDDVIRVAGGENIAGDSIKRYPMYNMEEIIRREPDVILDTSMKSGAPAKNPWRRWPSIPAVKNGRVVPIESDLVTRAGPRLFDALELVARSLHPEHFAEKGPQP